MSNLEKDKGWAWVVLAASALSLYTYVLITPTTAFCLIEIKDDLGVGSGPIAIIGSLAIAQATLLGPLSGTLASLLSVRVTIIIGATCLSCGVALASLAESVLAFAATYGFLTGFGYGIAYTATVVGTSFHFERHRILANGIIMCAPGVAFLSQPYLITWGLRHHGWRWTYMLVSALILQIAVMGSLFFPTDTEKETMLRWRWPTISCRLCFKNDTGRSMDKDITPDASTLPETRGVKSETTSHSPVKNHDKMQKENGDHQLQNDLLNTNNEICDRQCNVGSIGYCDVLGTPTKSSRLIVIQTHKSHTTDKQTLNSSNLLHADDRQNKVGGSLSSLKRTKHGTKANPQLHADAESNVCCEHLLSPNQNMCKSCSSPLAKVKLSERAHTSMTSLAESMSSTHFLKTAAKYEDDTISIKSKLKRVISNKTEWVLCLNSFTFIFGYSVNAVHFPAFAASQGVTRDYISAFYTAFGVVLMASRLGGGAFLNRFGADAPLLPVTCILQLILGLVVGLSPYYATHIMGLYIMQTGLAFTYGVCFMLYAPICAQLFGVKLLSISFGLVQMCNGVGGAFAPAVAGFLFDATGTFDLPLILAGSLVILGALPLTVVTCRMSRTKDFHDRFNQEQTQ